MQIKIVNTSKHPLPAYETLHAAGMDFQANLDAGVVMKPLERNLVPTGLFVQIPIGYEAQIRPRSGLAYKQGVTCLNTPGTIDADYRGEVKVLLVNLSSEDILIKDGMRIAQMVISKHEKADWQEVDALELSDRGTGGFGSTGV